MAAAKKSPTKKATEKKKIVAKPKVVKKITPPEPQTKADRPLTEKEKLEEKEIQEMIANAAKAEEPAAESEPTISTSTSGESKEKATESKDEVVQEDTAESAEEKTELPSTTETPAAISTEEHTESAPTQEPEADKPSDQSVPLITDTVTVEKHRRLWPLLVLFFLIGLIAGGVFFMTQKTLDITHLLSFTTPSPTPSPSPIPSPTPEETLPSEYKIKVLNGSGTGGEAAKVKELLEASDFVVSDIGNADKDDYTKTEIQAKKYVTEAFIKKLREKLSDTYDVSTDIGTPTGDDGIVVIIGSKKTP